MKIVIGSAGRRVYLVRWFQEAMSLAGVKGEVHVFENNKSAASVAVADGFTRLPPYEDPKYRTTLLAAIERIRPQLFISLNDYELTRLAGGLAEEIRERGVIVPSLTHEAHGTVADKLAMWNTLNEAGVGTPQTVLLSDVDNLERMLSEWPTVILKDRFGSGSSGLLRINSADLVRWLHSPKSNRNDSASGIKNPKCLIVQPELNGQEYGLDIVTPLDGGPVTGLLARRKLSMRHGETNVAETVEPSEFQEVASGLAAAFDSQGLIDVDVIRTGSGEYEVIDINPRFGGGYPFNHVAGANVPSYYVASLTGAEAGNQWKEYRYGFKAAKYEGIVAFDRHY